MCEFCALDNTVTFAENVAMKKSMLITLTIIGSAALIYANGVFLMQNRFPVRTCVNGTDVSLCTPASAMERLKKADTDYTLTILGRGFEKEVISGKEIGLHTPPVSERAVSSLLETDPGLSFSWPLKLFSSRSYQTETVRTYDTSLLMQALHAFSFMDPARMTEAGAAYVGRTKEGDFAVLPGEEGTVLDVQTLEDALIRAVDQGESTLDLRDTGCYADPETDVDDPSLAAQADALNAYAHTVLHLIFPDAEEDLDASLIGGWLSYEDGAVELDEDSLTQYVQDLALRYNTFGSDRLFTTTEGEEITIQGGNYGWLLNEEKTKTALLERLLSCESGDFEPVFVQKAASVSEQDYGNTYVEVNLDQQHVWAYENGKLVVETDCVSGKVINGNFTPEGTYRLNFKQQDAVLRGDDYATPVSYWMPFNLGIGFHDATWRGSFGGEIYITNGSHGCVNLPFAAAKELYEHIQPGEAVLVYGGRKPDTPAGQGSSSASYASASGNTGRTGNSSGASSAASERADISAGSLAGALGLTDGSSMSQEEMLAAQNEAARIAALAQANYESLGLSPEEAAAQVQKDIAAQAAQQAQQQMASQAASQQQGTAAAGSSNTTQPALPSAADEQALLQTLMNQEALAAAAAAQAAGNSGSVSGSGSDASESAQAALQSSSEEAVPDVNAIAAQAQANYEATGMSPEEAAAKVQEDIAAQAAQQLQEQLAAQQAAAAATP